MLKRALVPMGVCERKAGVDLNTSWETKPEAMSGVPVLNGAGETGTEERVGFLRMGKEKGRSST